MSFADKVKHLREMHHWSNAEIAERGGLSADQRFYVGNWVRAKGNVSPSSIKVLSTAFQVPPEYWSSEEPREYLQTWLGWPDNAERVRALTRMPLPKRLGELLRELARVWPGHKLLNDLITVMPEDLESFLAGNADALPPPAMDELAEALGIDPSYLDEEFYEITPAERHERDRIITLAVEHGLAIQDQIELVNSVAKALSEGIPLRDVLHAVRNLPVNAK